MTTTSYLSRLSLCALLLMLVNCGHPWQIQREKQVPEEEKRLTGSVDTKANHTKTQEATSKTPDKLESNTTEDALSFTVENKTGKTVYVTCFSYLRRHHLSRWHWSKSAIAKIDNNASTIIDIGRIDDKHERNQIFGILGIFNTAQEAEESTYELLDDAKKMDLDLIYKLKGLKVILDVEKYGFKGPFFDYEVKAKKEKASPTLELDFLVENKTGKTIYACGFTYQKKAKTKWLSSLNEKDDMSTWRFDKTDVVKIAPNQTASINVDTIETKRDRTYVLGYLAIFDEDEKEKAEESTFELLESYRKLALGQLAKVHGKKIVLEIERYGVNGDIIEYISKPTRGIDFKQHLEIE